MRFKFDYIAPSNKRQYQFSCGAIDLEILQGLVGNALMHMPSLSHLTSPEYRDIHNRLRSMARDFTIGIKTSQKLGDDGNRIHNEPKETPVDDIVNDNLSENEA